MKSSAGILLFNVTQRRVLLLLVHPGGPFWARRDAGAWSIPKGEPEEGEDPQAAALREFREETGAEPPGGDLFELGEITQKAGKSVTAWAAEGDFDVSTLRSNLFELEWPPRSGVTKKFPEVDRAAWFDPDQARVKIIPAQADFLDRLIALLQQQGRTDPPGAAAAGA